MIDKIYGLIIAGDYEGLEKLAKDGVDINAPDRHGMTPASLAASHGSIKCLEALAKYTKNDINAPDNWGETPAFRAAYKGHPKCLEVLIKHTKKDINTPDHLRSTPAHSAARRGHLKCLEILAKHSTNLDNLDTHDNWGQTPADLAKICDKLKCVKFLNRISKMEKPTQQQIAESKNYMSKRMKARLFDKEVVTNCDQLNNNKIS